MKQFFLISVKVLAAAVMAMSFHLASAQGGSFDRYVEDESELRAGETIEEKVKNNFFLTTEVNKTECFVGETITAVFKLYTRLNADSRVIKRPSLTGFSVMEMVDGYNSPGAMEEINGKLFNAHLIRKVQLVPLQPGTFPLEGAEVEGDIHFRRAIQRSRGLSGLRNLLRRSDRQDNTDNEELQHHVILEAPTVNVVVKPLPESQQPADFSGAVGNFTVHLQMSDTKLRLHDPAKVRLIVKGSGNLPLITAPQIDWPAGIEVSDPLVNEDLNRYVYPLSGLKIFEYTFETKDTGRFVIPSLQFSYFDPKEKLYKTTETAAINYTVAPGLNKKPDKYASADYPGGDRPGFPLQWFWFGGVALIIVGWIIYQVFQVRKTKTPTPAIPVPLPDQADTGVKDLTDQYLAKAESALEDTDTKSFYNEIVQTLKEAIAFKCQVDSSSLTRNGMLQLLRRHDTPEQVIEKTNALLKSCEWSLYTPEQRVEDRYEALDSLKILLSELRTPDP